MDCHNPYFNRWFSAINTRCKKDRVYNCHNPYFNRWFSAIVAQNFLNKWGTDCHNPYFNRWFSAISVI